MADIAWFQMAKKRQSVRGIVEGKKENQKGVGKRYIVQSRAEQRAEEKR